jgi:hypothetical protein
MVRLLLTPVRRWLRTPRGVLQTEELPTVEGLFRGFGFRRRGNPAQDRFAGGGGFVKTASRREVRGTLEA